jgi:hypothetical protein
MSTGLDRIADKARKERKLRFTALAHLLTPGFLADTWRLMNRHGASGIDTNTGGDGIRRRTWRGCSTASTNTSP